MLPTISSLLIAYTGAEFVCTYCVCPVAVTVDVLLRRRSQRMQEWTPDNSCHSQSTATHLHSPAKFSSGGGGGGIDKSLL